jgi:hypothetical protein
MDDRERGFENEPTKRLATQWKAAPDASTEREMARDRSIPKAFRSTGAFELAVDDRNDHDFRFCRAGVDGSNRRACATV